MEKINFKKGRIILFICCISIGILSCNKKKEEQTIDSILSSNVIFPKGEKITNDNFTGEVWLNNLAQADSINQNAVGSVTFEPGARTKWHSHPAGQIILALDGVGYYQEKGNSKIIVNKGDVIKCPADIPHWHGASTDTKFVQVAITGREKGETIWLDAVNETEYTK
ncbi:cupin domain-containing protein [Flavobacterium hercynium]|uniref:Cupin n=1 Tax=Flavobacterium hercynium TaxID=387094 RepID=A0A226H8A3_9FLAO|nr:cupin domain-containing protein [Flavobacterium hercynium]OXA90078.1 cupin [Flavobacterium hercynium]SMP14781.1 Cupin domain-containing protein [Flavobacterium hercynium]